MMQGVKVFFRSARLRDVLLATATAVAALYFLALYVLPPWRYYNIFYLTNFDYGILFQSSHLLSRLMEPIMTVRGLHVWADNQDYFQWLFAPLHHLRGAHYWLLFAHSFGIYACGVFCLRYLRPQGKFVALAAAVAVWASPLLRNTNLDLFHTEAYSTICLLGVFWAAKRGRPVWFYLCAALALSCKEDVALTVGLFAVLAFVERRRFTLKPRHFGVLLALAVLVFFVNLKVVLPYFKARTCLWLDPGLNIENMPAAPAAPWFKEFFERWYQWSFMKETFLRPQVGLYAALLLWPMLLFVRRWSWLALLPAAGVFVNVVSKSNYLVEAQFHYDSCTMAAVIIVVIEGLAACRYKRIMATILLALMITANYVSPRVRTPLHGVFRSDCNAFVVRPEVRFLEKLNRALPEDTVISADYVSLCYLLPGHPEVYMFENPFKRSYFGLYDVCEDFAVKPEVDLILVHRSQRLDDWKIDLIPDSFVSIAVRDLPFRVWANQRFLGSPRSAGFRDMVDRIVRAEDHMIASCSGQPNLLRNGGFEDVEEGGPRYWRIEEWRGPETKCWYEADGSWACEGRYSARMLHEGPADSRWVQNVEVKPRTHYLLSGWVKTRGVGADGAGVFLQIDGTKIRTEAVQSNQGWRFLTADGVTARKQREVKVQCRMGDYGRPNSGEVWFDDVRLREVPEP